MMNLFNLRRKFFRRPWRHVTALWSAFSAALTSLLCRSSFLPSSLFDPRLRPRALLATAVALALTANVASTLATYPHTLSYFNEIAGGPLNGPAHLLGSNIDWGQDLLFLKDWHDAHPGARPLRLDNFDPRLLTAAGVQFELMAEDAAGAACVAGLGGRPKIESDWLSLTVSELYTDRRFTSGAGPYASLHRRPPAARVAYSIRIYHLAHPDAGAIRRGSIR